MPSIGLSIGHIHRVAWSTLSDNRILTRDGSTVIARDGSTVIAR